MAASAPASAMRLPAVSETAQNKNVPRNSAKSLFIAASVARRGTAIKTFAEHVGKDSPGFR